MRGRQENETDIMNNTHSKLGQQTQLNTEILQHLKLTQGFLHAQRKRGVCVKDNPDHFEPLITVFKEKTELKHLTDNERFNILGSLLDGESESVYNRYVYLTDKTLALERVWRSLKLTYGYRNKNPMNEIYECSTRLAVESTPRG